jgi:L-talarate/galactarate dehydratase
LQLEQSELEAEARQFADQGYGAFKFKGGHGLEEDRRRLAGLRETLGPKFKLILDGNQQWTEKEAIRAARAFEPYDLWWLEEPVAAHEIEACARVRAQSPMNIATGETNFGLHDCTRLLNGHACDIFMPNLQRVGGITGWLKLASMAHLQGVRVASHVYAEIGVHLLCAVPNGLTLEVLPWWPRLFVEPLHVDAGYAVPPSAPGLGVTVDETVIAKHRYC